MRNFGFGLRGKKLQILTVSLVRKQIVHYFGILSKNDQYSSKARSVNSAFEFKKGHDMKNCPKKGSWRCFHVMTILRPVNLRKNRYFLGGFE